MNRILVSTRDTWLWDYLTIIEFGCRMLWKRKNDIINIIYNIIINNNINIFLILFYLFIFKFISNN
jgi:hypothetical protein